MISLPIHNASGQEVGVYEFDPAELASRVSKQLLHDVIVMYESNQRVGTARTRSRAEVAGTTQKMYRQKGTGRARAGSRRSPVRVGGGRTFAKRPIDWTYRLPKKAVKLATRMALRSKFDDGQVTILDELSVESPKTKVVADVLKSLGLTGVGCLLAVDQHDVNVWQSARNIADLRVSPSAELNTYDLLHQRQLLITKAALDQLRGQGVAAEVAAASEG
jgi:large subunit ribosomal protein L4